MADLVVSMGIEDRGVRRGLQGVEAMVHRTQRNLARNSPFGGDESLLKTEKGLTKIAGDMSGLPLKVGAVGSAFYAFKNAGEYIAEFESYLPKAERSMDGLTASVKRFKDSWAMDARAGAAGTAGVMGGLIDLAGTAREYYTDYVAVVAKLAAGGGADLAAGDTPWAYRKAQQDEYKQIAASRQAEQSLVRRKQMEAEIASVGKNRLDADLKSAEARRAAASIELGRKVRDEGFGGKAMFEERNAIRSKYDADVAAANREQKVRDEEAADQKAAEEKRRRDEENKAARRAVDDELQMRKDAARAMEARAETPEERLEARRERARLDFAERIADLNRRAREEGLDKPGFMRLGGSAMAARDAEIGAAEGEYARAESDRERAVLARREGALIDLDELKAQVAAAKARTAEEKLVARELEAQAKLRRDEAIIRNQGLDPDVEAALLRERRGLMMAELTSLGPSGRGDGFAPGLDLSTAGAFASQGQAMAFQIPGKIDRTNALLSQANQTLREIKQGQDGTARFSP